MCFPLHSAALGILPNGTFAYAEENGLGMKTDRSVGGGQVRGNHQLEPFAGDQRVQCFCETTDLGCGFPCWHALLFEEGVIVDIKVVCPQDVKNMLGNLAK